MAKKKDNKHIKCNVESCIHNDCDCNYCELDEIQVTCSCDNDKACKQETICDSFEECDDCDDQKLEEEYETGKEYYEEVEEHEEEE